MKTNHPIIIRFSAPNHPIGVRKRLHAKSESTDNRPIFYDQSSDTRVGIVRNRQKKRTESSDRILNASRHFSRQNGESGRQIIRIPGDPAIYPAILRDSPATGSGIAQFCRFSCRNGRRRTKSGQESGHRVRILETQFKSADLSVVVPPSGTKVEARETDKALRACPPTCPAKLQRRRKLEERRRKILEEIGV